MPRITLEHQHPALPQLAEQGAMLAQESIPEFNDRHRESKNFSLNFAANPPQIVFEGIGKRYVVQFLGSFSGLDNTWMWGWNNINQYPDAAIQIANNLRKFGEMANVPELTTPVLPIASEVDIHRLLFAAIRITGRPAFHRAPTEHGHVYYLLHDYEMLPPGVAAVQRAIMGAIHGGWIVNHPASLDAYLEMRPLTATDTEKGKIIHCADGDLELEFDDHQRIATVRFQVNEQTAHGLRGGQTEN